MTELLLIRHGETEWNAGEIFRGRADIDLNETGILQAKLLAEYLADLKPEAVYSSPLIRALRTAGGIAKRNGLDITIEPGLIDIDYGEWQGMPLQEVRSIYGGVYRKWEKTPEKAVIPGGESLDDVKNRADKVIGAVVKKHCGTVVLVSHRVVNKVMICSMLGLGNAHFWEIRQDTCGITEFIYQNGKYVLTGHNDISFLKKIRASKLADF